jgi:glycosyltransferase involved in cell wall biosynthesis
MRIAIFAERFPASGGGIAVAHEALATLLAKEHEVSLYAFADPSSVSDTTICRKRGNQLLKHFVEWLLVAKVRKHAPHGELSVMKKIANTFVNIRAMNASLKYFNPQVIISSDDQVPLLGLNPPKHTRVIWVAHHNYSRFLNHPYITLPCPYEHFLAHRLELRSVRKAHHAVFPSKYMENVFRSTLSESVPGIVIPNYVRPLPELPPREALRAQWGIQPNKIGIFFPSGGTDIKGSRFLPEIIRRLCSANPQLFFVISGPIYDSLRPELEFLKSRGNIIAPGPLPLDENLKVASLTDFCISPAMLENYSCALLECQLLGLPVITFDVGGNPELIEQHETGWSVTFNDIDAIVVRAQQLISAPQKLAEMSQKSVKRATRLTDASNILNGYRSVWDTLGLLP